MDRPAVAGDLYVPSFFEAEEVPDEEIPKVRDMTVARVTNEECREFARRYHYAKDAPNQLWRYGLWHGVTLWGFAGYNLPTRDTCESVFGPEHYDKVAHLSRLACVEHSPRNSESRLISGSLKLLHEDKPDIWAVLTFSDLLENHVGYVYQATNAIYTGLGAIGQYRYVTPSGEIKGTYINGRNLGPAAARARGWEVIQPKGKHRYLYILGNKAERRARMEMLRLPVLPYPKATDQ